MKLLVQQIPAQTFRSLKAPSFDFAESIQVFGKRFKVAQPGAPVRPIIKIHMDGPATLDLVWLGRNTALSLGCSDDADAQADCALFWGHRVWALVKWLAVS